MADKYKQRIEAELGKAVVEQLEMENKNWLEVNGNRRFRKRWHKIHERIRVLRKLLRDDDKHLFVEDDIMARDCLEEDKMEDKKKKLKIIGAAILNEDKPEFFAKLLNDGVDAVEPEMKKQLKELKKQKGAKA